MEHDLVVSAPDGGGPAGPLSAPHAARVPRGRLIRVAPSQRAPSPCDPLPRAAVALARRGSARAQNWRPLLPAPPRGARLRPASPPLFLWVEKLVMLMSGPHENALRALPPLAGLLVPMLTYLLAARLI